MAIGDGEIVRLADGAPSIIDCVGSETSIADAISIAAPRAQITMVGMPGLTTVDLTGLWHKELNLVGSYAYGTEHGVDGRRTFDLAFEIVEAKDLGRLVTASYPLSRYSEAVSHAAAAGARGAVKIAFDLRDEKERGR
jgi:threonine dehydrogenase-like Zn-dependent dehydrogenase